jgi:hypothetical protein
MKKYALLTSALISVTETIGVAGVHIVGGPYTTGNTLPFWSNSTYYPQVRWQCLWRQNEIAEAGYVSKIEWLAYDTTLYGGTFHGCKILLAHSSLATLTAAFADNYEGNANTAITVFEGDYLAPTPAPDTWATIIEPWPTLTYNNTDNLLMEVSWTGYTGGGSNYYRCNSTSGYGGRVYAASATATRGTLNTYYSQYARISFYYLDVAPTSLGRIKGLYN